MSEQLRQLESHWRSQLQSTSDRYAQAVAECKKVMTEFREGDFVSPDGSMAVSQALRNESEARHEYMRVLRIFTDLTVYGKVPDEKNAGA